MGVLEPAPQRTRLPAQSCWGGLTWLLGSSKGGSLGVSGRRRDGPPGRGGCREGNLRRRGGLQEEARSGLEQ